MLVPDSSQKTNLNILFTAVITNKSLVLKLSFRVSSMFDSLRYFIRLLSYVSGVVLLC